jgi:hypothetical protein
MAKNKRRNMSEGECRTANSIKFFMEKEIQLESLLRRKKRGLGKEAEHCK